MINILVIIYIGLFEISIEYTIMQIEKEISIIKRYWSISKEDIKLLILFFMIPTSP